MRKAHTIGELQIGSVQFWIAAKADVQQPQATYCTPLEPKADHYNDIPDVPLVADDYKQEEEEEARHLWYNPSSGGR